MRTRTTENMWFWQKSHRMLSGGTGKIFIASRRRPSLHMRSSAGTDAALRMAGLLLGRAGQLGPDAREIGGPQVLAPALAVGDQLDIRAVQAGKLVAVGNLSQVADGRTTRGAPRLSFGFRGIPEPLQQWLDGDAGLGMGICAHA